MIQTLIIAMVLTQAATSKSPPGGGQEAAKTPSLIEDAEQWLSDYVEIRQSVLVDKNLAKPATLSWTYYEPDDNHVKPGSPRHFYQFNGAIEVVPYEWSATDFLVKGWSLQSMPFFAYEANVSTAPNSASNMIVQRLGMTELWGSDDPRAHWFGGHNFDVMFDYTTDSDYRADIYGGTFQYSPNCANLGIGQAFPWIPESLKQWVGVRWRPYIGIVGATVSDPGEVNTLKGIHDYANFFTHVVANVLIAGRITLGYDLQFWRELRNAHEEHTLSDYSVSLALDQKKHFSLVLEHIKGQASPTFQRQGVTTLSIGIQF